MKKIIVNLFAILLVITFYFKGDTLYWKFDGSVKPEYYLRLQLDHNYPPTINTKPIKKIVKLMPVNGGHIDSLVIFTEDRYWILHYTNNPEDMLDWYVEDWKWR